MPARGPFTGKRTDPLELPRILRADPELGRVIRNRAVMNRRTIQLELLDLIETRVNVDQRGFARLLSSYEKRRRKAVA